MTSTFQINRYTSDLLTSTEAAFNERFPTVMRYASDPEFRARLDAERATEQRRLNLEIRGNAERGRERNRICREVNEALVILTMEAL